MSMHSADEISLQNWEDAHLDWLVIMSHQVLVTSPEDDVREETEVPVEHRGTGAVLGATGADAWMALAMIDHLISERF